MQDVVDLRTLLDAHPEVETELTPEERARLAALPAEVAARPTRR